MTENKDKKESGRSMVEMLGVLAIVGLLSIGSVIGYRFGVTKYRANETINQMDQLAVMVATQLIQQGVKANFNEVPNQTQMSYPLSAKESVLLDYFEFEISDVPARVCNHILAMNYRKPSAIYVGNTRVSNASTCGEEGNVSMRFEYYKDFDEAKRIVD